MPASSPRYRAARRLAAAVIGGTLLALGLIMLATPGPGPPVIAAGLGVLAIEFYWARRWLVRLRRGMRQLSGRDPGP